LDALNRVLRELPYHSPGQDLIHDKARYLANVTARARKADVAATAATILQELNASAEIRAKDSWNRTGDNYSAVARLTVLGGAWEMGHGGDRHGDHNGVTWAPNHVVDVSEDLQLLLQTAAPATGCAGDTNCQGDRTVWALVHDSNGGASVVKNEVMNAANGLGSSYVTAVWDASQPSAAPTTTLDLIKWYVNGHIKTELPTADPTLGPTEEPTMHPTFSPTDEAQYNSLTPTLSPTVGATEHPTIEPTTQGSPTTPVTVGTPGSPQPNGVAEARVIELVKQYSKDDSSNTAAVVLGVIVGLMVLAGFIGVGYWYQNQRAGHQARGHAMANQIQGKQNLAVA
jgi:hypothetical protein